MRAESSAAPLHRHAGLAAQEVACKNRMHACREAAQGCCQEEQRIGDAVIAAALRQLLTAIGQQRHQSCVEFGVIPSEQIKLRRMKQRLDVVRLLRSQRLGPFSSLTTHSLLVCT
eukprot:7378614-Prymnesium_polylepis.1